MDVSKLYTKVEEALKRKNYDYAVETLKNQILKFNPNDVKARKLLRATTLEKYKFSGFPPQSEVWSKGLIPRIKMIVGKLAKKWDLVVDEAENFLLYDPKNISVLYALGEACMEAGYTDTSISVFENVLACDGNNVSALKALGRIYQTHKEDLGKAQQYYRRASKVAPNDLESSKMVKDLSARITADTYGQAKSSQDLLKDQDKARELEEEQAILRTEEDFIRAIERTKRKLANDPNNKKELKRLGSLYQKLGRFENAVEYYSKVLQLDPTNSDVKTRISLCKIQKIDKHLQKIKETLQQNPNNDRVKQEYDKTLRVKLETEIREYSTQVKDQPTNYDLRFRLGLALFQAARFDDSIAQFQFAVKDPRRKALACNYMGQAFTKKKDFDMAVVQFKNALEALSPKDRQYKETLYNLALTYETAKSMDKALQTYTTIYKEDINFRDVRAKLKKLRP